MLDVELVLQVLFFDFLLNLVNPSIVLTLKLSPSIAVISKDALFCRLLDLLHLLQLQLQSFNHLVTVLDVLLEDRPLL